MSTIKELFKKRDQDYIANSEAILNNLIPLRQAVLELLDVDQAKHLAWKSTELVDDIVVIFGHIEFPIGHVVKMEDGSEVTVTEQNQSQFSRTIRGGATLEIVNKNDKEAIKEFMQQHETERKANAEPPPSENLNDEMVKKLEQEEKKRQEILWFAEHTSKGKIN